MSHPKILAFVLAGGRGERLAPLTDMRTKPSVPFGGRYRIVDFVLSSLFNSHIYSIYLLVQYKSQSLIEHVRQNWVLSPLIKEHFVAVVPPQMKMGPAVRVLKAEIENSVISEGAIIRNARIRNSIIRSDVVIEDGALVEDSIIMDHTVIKRGCRLRRVIVDKFNVIAENMSIGFDPGQDRRAGYLLDKEGITVVPKAVRSIARVCSI